MFGWDWGPRIPDAGIFREASLKGVNRARIESVYITQKHEDGRVTLGLKADILPAERSDIRVKQAASDYRVTLITPQKEKTVYEGSPEQILIREPQIWWPAGYGEQPLYTVRVELLEEETVLDSWERRIGLRTMTVSREKDQYGEAFAHEVNGVRIFAMGADYIPEDNLLSRVTRERTRRFAAVCQRCSF